MDDWQLLNEYATRNSEDAFRTLVDRYAGHGLPRSPAPSRQSASGTGGHARRVHRNGAEGQQDSPANGAPWLAFSRYALRSSKPGA